MSASLDGRHTHVNFLVPCSGDRVTLGKSVTAAQESGACHLPVSLKWQGIEVDHALREPALYALFKKITSIHQGCEAHKRKTGA